MSEVHLSNAYLGAHAPVASLQLPQARLQARLAVSNINCGMLDGEGRRAHHSDARLSAQLRYSLMKQRPHPPTVWSSRGANGAGGRGHALVGAGRAGRRHCKVWVVQWVGVWPCQVQQVLPRCIAEVALPQKYASSGFQLNLDA